MRTGSRRVDVEPLHHLAPGTGDCEWVATGQDPQFAVHLGASSRVSRGFYRFDVESRDACERWADPSLYVDPDGRGFTEARRIGLSFVRTETSRASALIDLPRGARRLRFDPCSHTSYFHLAGASLTRVSSLETAVAFLKRWWSEVTKRPSAIPRDLGAGLLLVASIGFRKTLRRIHTAQIPETTYDAWIQAYDTLTLSDLDRIRAQISQFSHRPLISILMPVYNPPLDCLKQALDSVRAQLYEDWELCIADDRSTNPAVADLIQAYVRADERIRAHFRERNGHISAASNSALAMARGEYVALLDQDDTIPAHALYMVAEAVNDHPDADIIYSDEDKIDENGRRVDPYFKCDWNEGLFLSHNMISHLGVYRTSLARTVGGFREGYEGSQDYDLALRCIEQSSEARIVHVPFVLYHWRAIPGSAASSDVEKEYAYSAAMRALADHLERTTRRGEVLPGPMRGTYRCRFTLPDPAPLVSIIVPTRDAPDLIRACITSVLARTTYANFEVVIADNQTTDEEARTYLAEVGRDPRVRVIVFDAPFNYSAINNYAVRHCRGDVLCLLNNDIEVITPDWLEELVSHAVRPRTGAVGAKLLYPDDTVQHAGVVLGILGVAGHPFRHNHADAPGPVCRAIIGQELSAVTGACLVVRREVFEEVGGLNETDLAIAFNDVDFCIRLLKAGYRNYWTPYALLYHHESKSRGYENTPERQARFAREVAFMRSSWAADLDNDPAYSPNLTLSSESYGLAFPPRALRPWERGLNPQ